MASSMKENKAQDQGKQNQETQNQQNQGQQNKSNGQGKEGVRADKGTGYFPLSDLQFDVVMVLNEKSKALQAYDKYILDAQPCAELRDLFDKIRTSDREHVEALKMYLGKCLTKESQGENEGQKKGQNE